jgi:hypothetical protein
LQLDWLQACPQNWLALYFNLINFDDEALLIATCKYRSGCVQIPFALRYRSVP